MIGGGLMQLVAFGAQDVSYFFEKQLLIHLDPQELKTLKKRLSNYKYKRFIRIVDFINLYDKDSIKRIEIVPKVAFVNRILPGCYGEKTRDYDVDYELFGYRPTEEEFIKKGEDILFKALMALKIHKDIRQRCLKPFRAWRNLVYAPGSKKYLRACDDFSCLADNFSGSN